VELFNNSGTKYVNIDIQGRGKKSIYGNADNINTREREESIGDESSYMGIWKKLSKTELPPTIITRCNNVTREGVVHYAIGEYEKAVKSFGEAASYGYAPALANIGKCYFDGKGVGEDKNLGMRYFEMAAEKGNNLAMHHLGDIYHEGKIVAGNDSLAYEYYRKAAENNFAASQRMMGVFHEEGTFIDKDPEKALKWYNLAALQNDPDALYKVGIHIVAQDSINGLSKRQLRKSQAINYMRKAARGGNIEAQRFIVKCFADGKYLKKSRKKSFEWMKSIADVGNEEAMLFVAYCHEKGRGTAMNHNAAYHLYKKLAEKGNEFAIQKVYEFELFKFFMYNSPKPPGMK
jgi:TPR repeat protein